MFSPLYVGLYLFKSYTGEAEDQEHERHATGDLAVPAVQREDTDEQSDIVLDVKDDVIDGLLEEDQSERIEDLLEQCSAREDDTGTNLSPQNANRGQADDDDDDANDIVNDKFNLQVTNNNMFTSEDVGLPRVMDYSHNDCDNEDDDTGSVEFVDSQPITENIKSARIKQNKEIFNDLIARNQNIGLSNDKLDDAIDLSENFAKEMFVAESKLLMQDIHLQNESIIYEDIKHNTSLEVLTPCNNDIIESSAHTRTEIHQHDLSRTNGIEFDLSGQSAETHIPYRCITEEVKESQNSDDVYHVNASSEDGTCSVVNPVEMSALGWAVGIDRGLTSGRTQTVAVDDGDDNDVNVTTPDTDIRKTTEIKTSSDNGVDKIVFEDLSSAKEVFLQEYACSMKQCTSSTTLPTEQPISAQDFSGTSNMSQTDDNRQMNKSAKNMLEEQVDIPSLGKNNFSSNSDSEFSDLSDTVVADDMSSGASSASDLPEDDVTPSCTTASLSRPTDLDILDSVTNNSDVTNNDPYSSALSPSKVLVTCITEEETILVEEIVIPTHQCLQVAADTGNKQYNSLSPGTASSRVRSSPFSSTECLDFDWNEHCLRMIVTGTPDNSLKMAVTGTPKSPTRYGGSSSMSSRDLSGKNKVMREDVQTLRSEMKNKNEEISRLKNITHGLRHRLTRVEQENLKLSQSNDSFLSVRSETPSNASSCYNSVVSLSYEGALLRSPSLEENLLLKEEILLLKAKLDSKSDTIEELNSKSNELKARLIEEEHASMPKSESINEKRKVPRRRIRTVKSVNDISVEEMPRITPPSSAGSASSVFVNSATLPIPTLSEQTSKKTKTKKIRKLFSFRKKKDKKK